MPNKAHLILLSGKEKGRTIPIEGEVSIGRQPGNTLQLDDLQVSRRHARIRVEADGIYVEDLGSGNGVYVGALRVDNQRLDNGDIVRIG